jgi:hypothetical protein
MPREVETVLVDHHVVVEQHGARVRVVRELSEAGSLDDAELAVRTIVGVQEQLPVPGDDLVDERVTRTRIDVRDELGPERRAVGHPQLATLRGRPGGEVHATACLGHECDALRA